jgi:two-component system response regulator HupR/HoxA
MGSNNAVLVLAADGDGWSTLTESLSNSHGYRVKHARSLDEATGVLAEDRVDLVIAEHGAPPWDGCEFLAALRTSHPDAVRVLAVDGSSDGIARAAVYQFLHLPIDPEQACLVVKRGLEARELSRRHRLLSREFKLSDYSPDDAAAAPSALPKGMRFDQLVYASDQMTDVCRQARIAARTDLPVLIQGETGTGKELLARAIHDNSLRRGSPLVVQNCAGIPEALLQSELFGHKRGAFTGAVNDRLGVFRSADGGTVFLDEISEISPAFQISLLRFLQDGEIKPLGAEHAVPSKVRIIAASSRPLKALAARGEFRRDLYYRLKGFELEIPALRDRPADVAPLAELFAQAHSAEIRRRTLGISARALDKLVAYEWPGNVRELENEIRRLVVLTGDGEYITTQHMSPALLAANRRPAANVPLRGQGKTLKDQVQNLEKHLVYETLERCQWNQSKAAGELGLSRVGLANKIRRYGLAEA